MDTSYIQIHPSIVITYLLHDNKINAIFINDYILNFTFKYILIYKRNFISETKKSPSFVFVNNKNIIQEITESYTMHESDIP